MRRTNIVTIIIWAVATLALWVALVAITIGRTLEFKPTPGPDTTIYQCEDLAAFRINYKGQPNLIYKECK